MHISCHLVQDDVHALTSFPCCYKDIVIKGKPTKKKEVNTKKTSMNAAKRIFPNVDFRKNERCKKPDDNKIDSLLIAEYARRKNL